MTTSLCCRQLEGSPELASKLCIGINMMERDRNGVRLDFNVTQLKDFKSLLEDHGELCDLSILFNAADNFLTSADLMSALAKLQKLERLELSGFVAGLQFLAKLGQLPQVKAITLQGSQLDLENLSCVSDNIREITIKNGFDSSQGQYLLRAMQSIHSRGVPLEKLVVLTKSSMPNYLALAEFMFEHFPSLRVFDVSGRLDRKSPLVPEPLQQMVAVNIEKLRLGEIDWPSKDHYQQFFDVFLAQPLPNLRSLFYVGSNIALQADTIERLWQMCPNLKKMLAQQECGNPQCAELGVQCKGGGHISILSRP